jgi:hypothetical protein
MQGYEGDQPLAGRIDPGASYVSGDHSSAVPPYPGRLPHSRANCGSQAGDLAIDGLRGDSFSAQVLGLDRKLSIQVTFADPRAHRRYEASMTINEGAAAREREWNDGAGLHGAEDHARAWLVDGQSSLHTLRP